jgi:hypothetical protein
MPIGFQLDDAQYTANGALVDVGAGGLCLFTDQNIPAGEHLHINITETKTLFETDGEVKWTKQEGGRYQVGVSFSNLDHRFALRMVEQMCQIEAYREAVAKWEHRYISSDQAAEEWIAKYAKTIPLLVQ